MSEKILYKDLSYQVCGFCFKAQNELGRFRSERSYGDHLEGLFKTAGTSFAREVPLSPSFETERERRNIPDFIIEDAIILDIKAKTIITKEDYFQMKRYLAVSGKKLGLIVNFRQKHIVPKRVLGSHS